MKRTNHANCLLSLYSKHINEITSRCSIAIVRKREVVHQINSTSFYVFVPKPTIIYITCDRQDQEEKHEINNYNIVNLDPGCKASIKEHIFSAGIKFEERSNLKYMKVNINLQYILGIGQEEEKALIKLLREEQTIGNQPVKIVDAKRKYKLKLLEKHSTTVGKVLGSTSVIIVIAIAIIAAIMLKRRYNKKNTRPIRGFGDPVIIKMSDIIDTTSTNQSYQATTQPQPLDEEPEGIPFKTEIQNK